MAMLLCEAAFIALTAASMQLYPGGTQFDPPGQYRLGHSFWLNFLCDLERSQAINGQPNPAGSNIFAAAMVSILIGFGFFWLAVPGSMGKWRRLGQAARILGLVSIIGLVCLALMPADRFGMAHAFVIIASAGPGLAAAVLAAIGIIGSANAAPLKILTAATLAASLFSFLLYVNSIWLFGGESSPLLPVAQKIAAIFVLIWMGRIGLAGLRSR
ncbi:MAG: hypothetical protein HZA50_02795 [Planctomycetes bacterium]|nr:hypothetical protein [Planctomycetota bacterium]